MFMWALVLSFLLGREVKIYILINKFLIFVITSVFCRLVSKSFFVCFHKAKN